MSSTIVVWPIIAAISKALLFINAPVDQTSLGPINDTQTMFVKKYFDKHDELVYFNDKEIRSWASSNMRELNNILKQEGFDIQLIEEGDFGVVSILDVLIKWANEGTKSTIICPTNNCEYPAIQMEKGFSVYSTAAHNHPLLCIKTKSNDMVWMTIADQPLEGFPLMDHVNRIRASSRSRCSTYTEAIFPMVDLDQKVDIKWLIGLQLYPSHRISQALQQTKFKMNETGAHAKSAVAIANELTCICKELQPPCILKIDEPFYIWIERADHILCGMRQPTLSHPIFVGYISQADWKDPKGLDFN